MPSQQPDADSDEFRSIIAEQLFESRVPSPLGFINLNALPKKLSNKLRQVLAYMENVLYLCTRVKEERIMNIYSKKELESRGHSIPATTLSDRPINKKTGKPFGTNSLRYWIWWHGLSENDKNVISDLQWER